MQLDADAGGMAWGLTGPGREAAEQPAGCPRTPAGSRECTAGQVVGSPPWSLPLWVGKNRLLPLYPSHQPRQTTTTWVSAGGGGRERRHTSPGPDRREASEHSVTAWGEKAAQGETHAALSQVPREAVRQDLLKEAGKMEKAMDKGHRRVASGHTEESVCGSAWPGVPTP